MLAKIHKTVQLNSAGDIKDTRWNARNLKTHGNAQKGKQLYEKMHTGQRKIQKKIVSLYKR